MIFFFNDTATTEIYTLSLHDALPICHRVHHVVREVAVEHPVAVVVRRELEVAGLGDAEHDGVLLEPRRLDRKSTRLNSSHANISYAVFCLKKKKKQYTYYHFHLSNRY